MIQSVQGQKSHTGNLFQLKGQSYKERINDRRFCHPSPQTSYSKTAKLTRSAKNLSLYIKTSISGEHTLNFAMQSKGLFYPEINRMEVGEERNESGSSWWVSGKKDWQHLHRFQFSMALKLPLEQSVVIFQVKSKKQTSVNGGLTSNWKVLQQVTCMRTNQRN